MTPEDTFYSQTVGGVLIRFEINFVMSCGNVCTVASPDEGFELIFCLLEDIRFIAFKNSIAVPVTFHNTVVSESLLITCLAITFTTESMNEVFVVYNAIDEETALQ